MMTSSVSHLFPKALFPYSKEIKDIATSARPNVLIDNENQSLYSILKLIRTELIGKKLHDGQDHLLMLDLFVNEFMGFDDIRVRDYYPPVNASRLDEFVKVLNEHANAQSLGLDCVLYYILKDFDSGIAESYIGSVDDITLRIPRCLYHFINSLYYLDRFDILRCTRHLNCIDNFTDIPSSMIKRLIQMSSIVPYHSQSSPDWSSDTGLKNYINVHTSKPSARSVISMVRSLKLNVWLSDADTVLMYIDCLTDLNPGISVRALEELRGNNTNVSWRALLKLLIIKILIKSIKQQRLLKTMLNESKISHLQFDQLFKGIAMFALVDTKINDDILEALYNMTSVGDEDEELSTLKEQSPAFFAKYIDPYTRDIVHCANNLITWKLQSVA